MKKNILISLATCVALFLEVPLYLTETANGFQIEYHIFFASLILDACVLFKIAQYLCKFKINGHYSRLDIVYLCCFFVILCLPMVHINTAEQSVQENRMLAKYHALLTPNGVNFKFGDQFNSWFSDRFFLRDVLLKLNFMQKLNKTKENNKMFVGKENWLFYKDEGAITDYQNKFPYTEKELEQSVEFLNDLNAWCEKNKIKFYLFITLEKHKVYGEYYKKDVRQLRPDRESRTNQFLAYLKDHSNIKVLYPYDSFHQKKSEALLYFKNDTHWNDYGAWLGYKMLMDMINKDIKFKILSEPKWKMATNEVGDLTTMMVGIDPDKTTQYRFSGLPDQQDCKSLSNEKGVRDFVCYNQQGTYRLATFRDSFTIALLPYYNKTFKQVSHFWRWNLTDKDYDYLKKNADILVFEVNERYLGSLRK